MSDKMSQTDSINVISINGDARSVTVVMASPSRDALLSTNARKYAINEAAKHGLMKPGLSDFPRPYPVDNSGVCSQDVFMDSTKVAEFRCDYIINGAI